MRITEGLRSLMLDFLEKNPSLVTNKFAGPNGREQIQKKWDELANLLNSQGFGTKSKEGWKNAFIDWKSKTKQKARELQNYQQGTGGGPSRPPLNEFEERLMQLLGWTSVKGDPGIEEFGLTFNEPIPFQSNTVSSSNSTRSTSLGAIIEDDHNYIMKQVVYSNKRPHSGENTPRLLKKSKQDIPLEVFHGQTLEVLKNIKSNIEKISISIEKIANHLCGLK